MFEVRRRLGRSDEAETIASDERREGVERASLASCVVSFALLLSCSGPQVCFPVYFCSRKETRTFVHSEAGRQDLARDIIFFINRQQFQAGST